MKAAEILKPTSGPAALLPTRETSQFGGLMVVSVVAASAGMLFLLAPSLGLPLRLFLAAIILLTLKYWGCVLILLSVQVDLFLREPPRSAAFQGVIGLFTVFLVVALLMFINRNRDLLRHAASRPLTAIFAYIGSMLRGEISYDSGKAVQEIPRIVGATIRGIAMLFGSVFVARILLSTLPTRRSFNQDLREWMLNDNFVQQCSLLLGCIVATWILLNEISWRQLTRDQSRLYLRSVLLLIHHTDLRMIIRGRLKLRRKAAHARKVPDSPPIGLNESNYSGTAK